MKVAHVRWMLVAVLTMTLTNNAVRSQDCEVGVQGTTNSGNVVCCAEDCEVCVTLNCEGVNCCPEDIFASGQYCGDNDIPLPCIGGNAPAPTPTPATTPSPRAEPNTSVPVERETSTTVEPETPAPEIPPGCGESSEEATTDDGVVVCCSSECDECSEANGCSEDEECCPSTIARSNEFCDDKDPPCILASGTSDSGDSDTGCGESSEEATTDDGVVVCCSSECDECSEANGCSEDEECCPSTIARSNEFCDDKDPPCILASGTSDSGDSDTGTSTVEIVLATLLAAMLVVNVICCFVFKRRTKPSRLPHPGPAQTHDPETDAELGRLRGLVLRHRQEFEAEQSRRMKADAIIRREEKGGIRPGEFPNVRDVDRDVEKLAKHAMRWTEKACTIGGSHPALLVTLRGVLQNTFLVCKEEVRRCFDGKLRSLSEFLGDDEPIELSGGDSMKLDTQYVLYECLRRNFRTIVPLEPERMEELVRDVEQRCGEAVDRGVASDIIYGEDAWPSFENLIKKYMMVFVEMTLQNPPMHFNDDLGKSVAFNSRVHRDWAQRVTASVGEHCCVVFPAILGSEGRPESHAKAGVVRLPA